MDRLLGVQNDFYRSRFGSGIVNAFVGERTEAAGLAVLTASVVV